MDNNFSSGYSNTQLSSSWTNSPILSTTPVYHNIFKIYYITGNFGDGSYIKGVIRDKNKVILTNNTNLNDPIFPQVIPSQESLSITDIANIVDTANAENNYQISIQTYTKNNVLFSTTNQLMVTFLVPTVVIESPSDDATIFNNTFELSYSTTNVDNNTNNKIVLYQGTDNGKDITNEPNPYPFTGLNSQSYTFKLQIVNKILALNPPIYSSIDIEMKVPTVEIDSPSTDVTIYNNTFELSYTSTNVGSNNKIVLYKDDDEMTGDITSPYTFTNLANGTYIFTLKIDSKDTMVTPNPDPVIQNQIIDIIIAIPEVSINTSSTNTTITSTTFDIEYTVAYIPTDYTLALYQTIGSETKWIKNCSITTSTNNTVIVDSPTTNANYTYMLKILKANGDDATTAESNDSSIVITIPKPTLLVNNATKTISDGYTYYYFKNYATSSNFTSKNSPVILSIDLLLVGGGGSGGNLYNFPAGSIAPGGGGAGAYVTAEMDPEINVEYTINIGAGAAGAGWANNSGHPGFNSTISGNGNSIIAYGGGGGGGYNYSTSNYVEQYWPGTIPNSTGTTYGSSGGVFGDNISAYKAGDGVEISDTNVYYTWDKVVKFTTQGANGYRSGRQGPGGGGTGGGGAGSNGSQGDAWTSSGGNGGNGKQWSDGNWYAGGGGGMTTGPGSWGSGGSGGGAGASNNVGATYATVNTGGGGGACSYNGGGNASSTSGQGGSGICVIRLLTSSFIQDNSSTNIIT